MRHIRVSTSQNQSIFFGFEIRKKRARETLGPSSYYLLIPLDNWHIIFCYRLPSQAQELKFTLIMAKKKKVSSKKAAQKDERVTLEDIEAMSDSDDDDQVGEGLNTKAKNLRDAIASGKFNGLIDKLNSANDDESDEEFEEAVLDGSSDDEDEEEDQGSGSEQDDVQEDDEEQEDMDDEDHVKAREYLAKTERDGDDDDEASTSDEDDDSNDPMNSKAASMKANNNFNAKALAVAVAELKSEKSQLPWAEKFAVTPSTPLPFGENGDPDSNPLDIHDDLKREVAFYNSALEAVKEARLECAAANIPFSRPEDFFAEMVKTDGMYRRRFESLSTLLLIDSSLFSPLSSLHNSISRPHG